MRLFGLLISAVLFAAPMAHAQEDSVFRDYGDYASFVDNMVKTRDFATLILRLGGRDEYTSEDLAQNDAKLKQVWPFDFKNGTVFRQEDLGGGISQEGRLYWTGKQYAYYYALLHDRGDALVVLSFHLNTNSKKVLERF
ncbi:MAG: hypothetical protein WBB25_01200 [Sulfitobacter sp.]